MSKTLGKTSGSVTVGRVPVGSPRARDFKLHGSPKTLKTLWKSNDSARSNDSAYVSWTDATGGNRSYDNAPGMMRAL